MFCSGAKDSERKKEGHHRFQTTRFVNISISYHLMYRLTVSMGCKLTPNLN